MERVHKVEKKKKKELFIYINHACPIKHKCLLLGTGRVISLLRKATAEALVWKDSVSHVHRVLGKKKVKNKQCKNS